MWWVSIPAASGWSYLYPMPWGFPLIWSQTILWNLGHARRYHISYTTNFHLITEITPVD